MNIRLLSSICILAFLASCSGKVNTNEAPPSDFLASNIDSSIHPGTDFFLYANNGWFRQNPIPASESSNGLWQLIRDTINAQIRDICEKASAEMKAPEGSNKQKIGDLYFSVIDSERDFHRTFGIKPGDALYRPDSLLVDIW